MWNYRRKGRGGFIFRNKIYFQENSTNAQTDEITDEQLVFEKLILTVVYIFINCVEIQNLRLFYVLLVAIHYVLKLFMISVNIFHLLIYFLKIF